MRAVLGLTLIIGGGALAYMAARGRTPFDATSASNGAASSPASDPANRNAVNGSLQNPTAPSQQQHNGGLP